MESKGVILGEEGEFCDVMLQTFCGYRAVHFRRERTVVQNNEIWSNDDLRAQ